MKDILLQSLAVLLVSTLVKVRLNEAKETTTSPEASTSIEFFDKNRPLARELDISVADGFTLAAVGDCIISRSLLQLKDPRFRVVIKIVRDADVTFGNLETNIIDIRRFKGYPQAETDGWWLISLPETAKDLKAMGFDLLSRANNHAMDWGIEGMRRTTHWLDEAGLVHAGSGEHRADARAVRYLETEHGRVALVSMTSSFKLARAAIDAGADAFVGHGVHRLMPIEIYKGKPISYSLGSFFWSDIQEPVAADGYEKYNDYLIAALGGPDKATDADLNAILCAESCSSDTKENLVFLSIIAVSKYEQSNVSEIRLYPVDLGYGMRLTQSGIPRIASPTVGRNILERLQQISQPYRTEIVIEDNVGVIRFQDQPDKNDSHK